MSVVMGTIIGLVGFLAFVAGGIVGYMQALSDAQAETTYQRAKANTPQWKTEIVDGDK